MQVQLFIPCFMDQLFPQTAVNTVRVLREAGCKIDYNPDQTCCGQPAFNDGFKEEAALVCQKFVKDFTAMGPVVTPSGSCAGFVRNHMPALLPKNTTWKAPVYELSEFLVNILGKTDLGARLKGKAVYHDACGALRECGIKEAPRRLLHQVQGLELLPAPDSETCCGFGGSFSVKFEPIAMAMAEQKVDNAVATGADYIISTDLSCLMHLEGYIRKFNRPIKVMHIADVLASR